MTTVAVGIAAHAEPQRLRATLEGVRRTVPAGVDILVLADHPDAPTAALAAASGLRTLRPDQRGGAACLNLLMQSTEAAVCVLLESGCMVAPGWLHHLLAGLASDPRNGLAGPSTNRSWNAQEVEPACRGSEAAITQAARRLEAMHGGAVRTLEPLFSLADFCYAVRRETWVEIGGADEGYGAGPCWEMDLNARAARAGWRGVWVPAAFVWRSPFTVRRATDERRLFEASRRRYQDRLCGLRLRGERTDYEPHCRGDACEHFAPPGLIQLRLAPRPATGSPTAPPRIGATSGSGDPPLVSCIMPTGGRPEFALQAVRYFQAQDYPRRELVIIDDAGGGLRDLLPVDDRVRCEEVPAGQSIGAKRNRAVELARGGIVAQWDDDDWYGPGRLSAQAAPVVAGRADVTALRGEIFFDLARWEFWTCTDLLHRRLFVHDVHGGTLLFRRSVWGSKATYPATSLAEDAAFLSQAVRHGARLLRVDAPGLFVYLRHGANAWQFACGRHLDPSGWRRVAEPPQLEQDRSFYRARSAAAKRPAARPLVSCLMPTADRQRFVPRAVEYFLRQTYPSRELVVVDDGRDPVESLLPPDPRIRYVRVERGLTLGAKRNLACSLARGELLAHWDDDDWMAPDRLSRQVDELEQAGAEVCGLSVVRYFDPARELAWEYRWSERSRPWVGGNTLLYRRSVWERRQFPHLNEGEDTRWIWALPSLLSMRDPSFFAALVHPHNTSRKHTAGSRWHSLPLQRVKEAMGADWHFYAALAARQATPVPDPAECLSR